MNTIISPADLHTALQQPQHFIVLLDCRFTLGKPEAGADAYQNEHLPDAHYLDLEKDLSSVATSHGGRHPLPDVQKLAQKLGSLGINVDSRVVVYDEQNGMMASRAWWLLRYIGIEYVQILNGGFTNWKKSGYETTKSVPAASPQTFVPFVQQDWGLAGVEYVKENLHNPNVVLIDSREKKRYLGLEEPIDFIAGHIPGAIHSFWQDVLTSEGLWKTDKEWKEMFSAIDSHAEIIVYCGSGVSACPNVLALKSAGFPNVKLYAGSWSDWISYRDNPIEKNR
ncbi:MULTISPECIES: sulfurtransferase [Priestia]|uniref:sulfurtransferase n=1 Tax=Priestia TaxID=2800373 RepID=UPI002D7EAE15|nr:sulfurtransferase [Priestia megaterium]MEB4859515.1 sulfurtransferase [Priestia megaterium]